MKTYKILDGGDMVNPAHYKQYPVECIHFSRRLNFNRGCAFKYIWREKHPKDIEKAIWHLEDEIDNGKWSKLRGFLLGLDSDLNKELNMMFDYMPDCKQDLLMMIFLGNKNELKEGLINGDKKLHFMLIYIAKEPLEYDFIQKKIILTLQRLQSIYAKDS